MAHGILQAVTGELPPDPPADSGKNPAAVQLGRLGRTQWREGPRGEDNKKRTDRSGQESGCGPVGKPTS